MRRRDGMCAPARPTHIFDELVWVRRECTSAHAKSAVPHVRYSFPVYHVI